MSKADGWENGLLLLVFNNDDYLTLGDGGGIRGSVVPGDIQVSLHTADPTDAGDQLSDETSYTDYLRKAVARSTAGWTVVANSVSPASDIEFAECGLTPGADLTHFGTGTASTGAGKLLYSGTLTPDVVMAEGVIPRVKTTSAITEN